MWSAALVAFIAFIAGGLYKLSKIYHISYKEFNLGNKSLSDIASPWRKRAVEYCNTDVMEREIVRAVLQSRISVYKAGIKLLSGAVFISVIVFLYQIFVSMQQINTSALSFFIFVMVMSALLYTGAKIIQIIWQDTVLLHVFENLEQQEDIEKKA